MSSCQRDEARLDDLNFKARGRIYASRHFSVLEDMNSRVGRDVVKPVESGPFCKGVVPVKVQRQCESRDWCGDSPRTKNF